MLKKRRAVDARAAEIVEESGVLWAVARRQAKSELGLLDEPSTIEHSDAADDGFGVGAVIACSVAALLCGGAAAVMFLDAMFRGSDGCAGYGSDCANRVDQAMVFGWGVLLVGFTAGLVLTFWRRRVWWSVLAFLSIPLSWQMYEWWSAGRYL